MIQDKPSLKNCELAHQTRRRLRIVAPLLRKHAAIRQVRVVPALGSAVVHFDPRLLPKAKALRLLDTLIGNLGTTTALAARVDETAVASDEPEREFNFALEGMTCTSCGLLVEMLLRRDPRIAAANVNFATETAQIRAKMGKTVLQEKIRALGYQAFSLDSLAQRRLQLDRERARIRDA
ncbi:MAG: copper-translocating P-type ATPase, partial [Proteobacteria bacterium]|nr:copper-translocating P-type ATPase [Pseudomonadota bacterium]